jgi:predicted SAM-dependent methyltransferase
VPEDKFNQALEANKFAAKYDAEDLTIQDWFMLAWARQIPELLPMPEGQHLNLGAGNRQIGLSKPLDLEHGWDAANDLIPFLDETISGIWAHGFFEHLSPYVAIEVLTECERVLIDGGVLNVVVPHALTENAVEELEHYSQWHEATIPNLIKNPYYEHTKSLKNLHVHTTFIMGVVWRNLALFTQLVKYG